MLVSAFGFADILHTDHIALDPSRMAAQVVSGIGFLGAGTIILRRDAVRGLTTAASVWSVAGIGLACGGGLYVAACGATLLTLLILVGLKSVETRWFERQRRRVFSLVVDAQAVTTGQIREAVESSGLSVERMVIHRDEGSEADRIEVTLRRTNTDALFTASENLRQVPGVREISLDTPPAPHMVTRR
jgi:putative Mg2+ transporter-C (MgtC) family protein